MSARQPSAADRPAGQQVAATSATTVKRRALAIKSVDGHTQFYVPVVNNAMKNKLLILPKKREVDCLTSVAKPMSKPTSSSPMSGDWVANSHSTQSAKILMLKDTQKPRVGHTWPSGRTATTKMPDKLTKDSFMRYLGKFCSL